MGLAWSEFFYGMYHAMGVIGVITAVITVIATMSEGVQDTFSKICWTVLASVALLWAFAYAMPDPHYENKTIRVTKTVYMPRGLLTFKQAFDSCIDKRKNANSSTEEDVTFCTTAADNMVVATTPKQIVKIIYKDKETKVVYTRDTYSGLYNACLSHFNIQNEENALKLNGQCHTQALEARKAELEHR